MTKRPWKNSQPNTTQGFNNHKPFVQPSQSNWNAPMSWKYWPQPWLEGWKNPYGKYPQYP